jgi:hypothetical protein
VILTREMVEGFREKARLEGEDIIEALCDSYLEFERDAKRLRCWRADSVTGGRQADAIVDSMIAAREKAQKEAIVPRPPSTWPGGHYPADPINPPEVIANGGESYDAT